MWTRLRRILSLPSLHLLLDRWRATPFGRLTVHFLDRLVRGEDTASSEFELGAGALLGLLAAPSAIYCFLLFDRYSSFFAWMRGHLKDDLQLTSASDKLLFITLAMGVAGLVTVLKWDRLLPDSQDYLNLAPLPVSPRRILLGNAVAILIAVTVVAVDVNAVPSLLFPGIVAAAMRTTFAAYLQFAALHAVCVLLASTFAICGSFALLGMISAILPQGTFRACSAWIRGGLLLTLLALLSGGFAAPEMLYQLRHFPDSAVRWFPPLWFLALYQTAQHRAFPALAALAPLAWQGPLAAFAAMVLSYALTYRKHFAGVLEGGGRVGNRRLARPFLAVLDLFAAGSSGFPRACHRFAVRALLRTETHRLVIAVAAGMGGLLALRAGATLEAPLSAAYLLILGLRIAVEIPADVPAAWVFRSALDPRTNETLGVTRRIMLSFVTPFVLVPWSIFACWRWGAPTATLQVLVVLALSLCAMEGLLAGYRKLPLTCPTPAFRENLVMLCLIQVITFVIFTSAGAAIGAWIVAWPPRFLVLPAAMSAAWFWNRRRLQRAKEAGELEEGLTFENIPIRTVERLDLS